MKVSVIGSIVTLFFTWLVAGKSFEQAILASKILFFGLVLSFVAGKLANFLQSYRYARSVTHASVRSNRK